MTSRIGALDPEHCAAIHLNMALGSPPEQPGPLSDEEQMDLAAMKQFANEESGYAHEQGTKPQTVGVALNDSPVGFLAPGSSRSSVLGAIATVIRRTPTPAINSSPMSCCIG
ncbi:MAG: hypothetical protein ACRDYE_05730 [Acidimicrobiales bacterium]